MFLFSKNQNIGPYVVVFPHKEGTYAQTYRVKDTEGKVKFLKLISLPALDVYQYDGNGEVIEAEVASALSHPNLCTFVDKGQIEINGAPYTYIVTEYVRGESLNAYIGHSAELSLQEIKQIMSALLSALQYLHSLPRPVIHNEVTLDNILLDLVGNLDNLKLIDFGAARYADLRPDSDSWHSQDLLYVAPERLYGDGSIKSDLFSAGVVLFRLLFGVMPWDVNFAGLTLQEQVQALIERRNKPLSLPNIHAVELDGNLVKVVIKALALEQSERFTSAQEFMDALNNKVEIGSAPSSMTKVGEAESHAEVTRPKGNGFADVAGMEEIKSMLSSKIIKVLKNPERAEKFKLHIPNGMLLYGPPGCGKSFIAEKFAEEAGYNYVFVKSSDLASIYIHGSQEKIGKLFDEARKNAPTILNFDEFEALVPNRSKIDNSSESGEVNEFLTQMNNCGKDRVFIIASSNRPDLIDPAIRRRGRIDITVYIPLPDKEARMGMFKLLLDGRPISNIDYSVLADKTEGYVSSDLTYIVNDAAARAFEDDVDITQELLEEVIKENPPSVSKDEVKRYEQLKKKMEGKEPERRPIGFA